MADGGEGTLQCIFAHKKEQLMAATVQDPLGNLIEAAYGITSIKDDRTEALTKTAVIEIAEASGLNLVAKKLRNPLVTSSYGTGQLILAALDQGCRHFIIALGGSATCDAGMGALSALGIQFKDASGNTITPNGGGMSHLHSIDSSALDPRLADSSFILAHDVDNPLLGLEGSLMYAAQKGATPEQVALLHKGYEQFAHIIQNTTGRNIGSLKGAGAAGGMAGGLAAFLNVTFKLGALVVMEAVNFRDKIQEASLLITGEGQIDNQTIYGKAPIAVAGLAKSYQIPVIAVCGNLKEGFEVVYHHGIDAVFSITRGPMTEEECFTEAKSLLINVANNIARIMSFRRMSEIT